VLRTGNILQAAGVAHSPQPRSAGAAHSPPQPRITRRSPGRAGHSHQMRPAVC